jgi:hypothetical protein
MTGACARTIVGGRRQEKKGRALKRPQVWGGKSATVTGYRSGTVAISSLVFVEYNGHPHNCLPPRERIEINPARYAGIS